MTAQQSSIIKLLFIHIRCQLMQTFLPMHRVVSLWECSSLHVGSDFIDWRFHFAVLWNMGSYWLCRNAKGISGDPNHITKKSLVCLFMIAWDLFDHPSRQTTKADVFCLISSSLIPTCQQCRLLFVIESTKWCKSCTRTNESDKFKMRTCNSVISLNSRYLKKRSSQPDSLAMQRFPC